MPSVNYNTKSLSDDNLKTVLQRLADLMGKDVKVSSGDRGTALSVGAGTGSLHLQNRAVDFHVDSEADATVYAKLKENYATLFDADKRYEIIRHGDNTETMGAHIHIGRFASGTPSVRFTVEGLTPETSGTYTTEMTLTVPKVAAAQPQ